MEVRLSLDQEAFVSRAIAEGRYRSPAEAIHEALSRREERERDRIELLSLLDESENDIANGDYADYTSDSLPSLASELKLQARDAIRGRN